MWFDPGRPGWGLSVAQRPNGKIFVAWFVFSVNGDPTWYTFEPPDSLGTDYNGPVYKTIATSRAAPFIPDIVSQAQVGTASLHFADHNHATFRYTVEGISGTADITRLPFEE